MNPLPLLVFILCLGSLSCFDSWVDTTPEIREECLEKENVMGKNIMDLDDMNVKCYYHCVYEKQGNIVNGIYRGHFRWCEEVVEDNKCELAKQIINCSMLRHGR